jgi:flagellar hook protein FlgE
MLLGSFYTGLSGLRANARALNVIGDNLANVNTIGFKRRAANFAEIMSSNAGTQNAAGNPIQIGLGVNTTEIISSFEQGSIQSTGIATQLALDGNGFFVLSNDGQETFTRAGNFTIDKEGYLVNPAYSKVQGYIGNNADGSIDTSSSRTNIKIDLGGISDPRATTVVRFLTNLNAAADFANSEDFQTSVEFYDSLGISHTLNVKFTSTSAGNWTYDITTDDGTPSPTTGTLAFDSSGVLSTIDGNPPADLSIAITGFASGAADQTITWDIMDDDASTASSYLSQQGTNSSNGTLFQDGYTSGVLQDVGFRQDGTMFGYFSNGQTIDLARLALATFNNPHGLRQIGNNQYLGTAAAGPASVDVPGSGGRGVTISHSLENSNVDMAEEFTKMIINQRGYQSNSKIITTIDTLLQETLNLKR